MRLFSLGTGWPGRRETGAARTSVSKSNSTFCRSGSANTVSRGGAREPLRTVTKRPCAVQADNFGRDPSAGTDTFLGISTRLQAETARHIGCRVHKPESLFRSIQEP